MPNDFSDRGGSAPTTSFEEWLDQHAANQGISREELFERLVSSYWTLNELMQLLDESGNGPPPVGESPVDGDRNDVGSGRGPSVDRSSTDRPSPPSREGQEGDRQHSSEIDEGRSDQLETLRDRVDELQADIEAEAERGQSLDGVKEAIAGRLTEIEAELDEIGNEVDATRQSLSGQYDSLTQRVDSLESEFDHKHEALASEQDDLATEQKQTRAWMDDEFGNLETILTYLVTQTDDLESDLSSAESRYEEALSDLQWERDTLQSIKRDAAALGVHEAECESCSSDIDLDLLSRPYCPNCENSLSGVEKREKWLFLSDAVVTTDTETSGRDAAVGSPRGGEAQVSKPQQSPREAPSQRQPERTQSSAPTDRRDTERDIPVAESDSHGSERNTRGQHPSSAEHETDGLSRRSAGDRDDDSSESTTPFEFGSAEFEDGETNESSSSANEPDSNTDTSSSATSPFGDLDDLEQKEGR
ncbi:hypothetical protein [Halobellus captivus]|uniref:hypothetical protein n=1 Tax=Halobellus captivus TaxID=2592614 RepID=UPI0011A29210|nr:hypothetical protein [Halobellus captivus]